MRKAIASLAGTLSASALALTVAAQTPDTSNSTSTIIGEVIVVVVVALIVAFIAYAGYKVVKKWSSGSS
jgi:hypothetical protein